MAGGDVLISITTLASASIAVSQIPSLLPFFLLVSNPALSFAQFLLTGKGEISEAKDFALSASIFVLLVPLALVQYMALRMNE